jgi:hypothetical protein
MKIKLKRSGGIVPVKKEAVKEVNWTDNDVYDLIHAAGRKDEPLQHGRDTTSYFLELENKSVQLDLEKIPLKYKTVFEQLKKELKPVKH